MYTSKIQYVFYIGVQLGADKWLFILHFVPNSLYFIP